MNKIINAKIILFIGILLGLSLNNKCIDAKIIQCKSHDISEEVYGEYIAVYDYASDTTTYYSKDEWKNNNIKSLSKMQPEESLTAKTKKLISLDNNIVYDESYEHYVNKIKMPMANMASITDNRIFVDSETLTHSPFYMICRMEVGFPSSVGYNTGYELWNRLCATAGHCILNLKGEYFNTLKAEFAYNNGNKIYTMTQNDLSGYVLHGEYKGTNWRPQIDYAFLLWNRDITNNVGHFGLSWEYSVGDMCHTAGYPADKDDCTMRYMYRSTSSINSITDCVIHTNNYSYQGQSGSPLFLNDNYAIGILSSTRADNSTSFVQLDNGLTTWLYQNGYFN